jgi:hypothetical protein
MLSQTRQWPEGTTRGLAPPRNGCSPFAAESPGFTSTLTDEQRDVLCEALGFAILMAVRNLFMWGSDWLGSAMLESFHVHFSTLVFINAGTTFLAVPLTQNGQTDQGAYFSCEDCCSGSCTSANPHQVHRSQLGPSGVLSRRSPEERLSCSTRSIFRLVTCRPGILAKTRQSL